MCACPANAIYEGLFLAPAMHSVMREICPLQTHQKPWTAFGFGPSVASGPGRPQRSLVKAKTSALAGGLDRSLAAPVIGLRRTAPKTMGEVRLLPKPILAAWRLAREPRGDRRITGMLAVPARDERWPRRWAHH